MALSAIINGTDGALSTATDPRIVVMHVIITIQAADYATGVGFDLTTLQSGFANQERLRTWVVRRHDLPTHATTRGHARQLYKIDAGATGDFIEVVSADLANNDKVTGVLYMTQAG